MSPKTKTKSQKSHKVADLKAKAVASGKASSVKGGQAAAHETRKGIIQNFRA